MAKKEVNVAQFWSHLLNQLQHISFLIPFHCSEFMDAENPVGQIKAPRQ